ncbi:hypothetical protein [Peribacillus simplex]|uniref:hypothetical protein n=1 Tax=Peribacillus simplex TaxID=1478 RepID=UPI003D2A2475
MAPLGWEKNQLDYLSVPQQKRHIPLPPGGTLTVELHKARQTIGNKRTKLGGKPGKRAWTVEVKGMGQFIVVFQNSFDDNDSVAALGFNVERTIDLIISALY